MFRRLALNAILTAGLTATFAAAADQAKTDINTLTPPFAVFLFSSQGFEFCDFFLITQNGLLAGGTHNLSTFCGAPDGFVSGAFGVMSGVPPFGSVPDHGYNLNSTVNCPDSLFYLFDIQKGTWANYGFSGGSVFEINSGTFTIGAPPAAGAINSGRRSTQKQ